MDAIKLALQDLRLSDKPNISATAKLYNVDRSTLSRRHRNVTNPKPICHEKEQLLSHQQEQDLVEYINKLTEKGLPPTTAMVRNFAEEIAGKRPGNSWSQRFCTRHTDVLSRGYLNTIDAQRKGADMRASYEYYFTLLKQKIAQYDVVAANTYNMDEKGFSLGTIGKHHRIFNKHAVMKKRVLGANQPGNREWITILATICGDLTWLPLAIIFAGKTGHIQST
jgi:uncharacterized protein YoaH (UPF0181 family)